MAINPFPRIQGLDIPTALPSGARAPEGTFANIASIGDAIGEYRTRNRLSEVARSAIDPQTGALDIQKFASGAALAGIDPMRALAIAEAARGRTTSENAQRALEAYHARIAAEAERANKESERQRQQQLDQPQQQYVPGTLMTPPQIIQMPKKAGEPPIFHPVPNPTIGPRSSLETPGPDLAAAEPNPEEAAPYAVAGPPMPSPQAPATAAPPPAAAAPAAAAAAPGAKKASAFNEQYLSTLPPNAQTIVKGVANYDIDPNSFTGKDREEVITAAKTYRPDYSMSEYQKVGSPPSAETQARLALAKSFIARMPAIKARLEAGELTEPGGKALAVIGQGGPGELRRAIDEGAEGLERLLTGAAMPASEAASYARRYTFTLTDTRETAIRKLNELENANRWMVTEVGHRRAGEDLLNGFRDKFGEAVIEKAPPARAKNDAEVNKLVGQAKAAVKRDPAKADEVLRILQGRLPQGVDARRLLGQ
jgi:hypothetical protein